MPSLCCLGPGRAGPGVAFGLVEFGGDDCFGGCGTMQEAADFGGDLAYEWHGYVVCAW